MMPSKQSLDALAATITVPWTPVEVVRFNGQVLSMSLFQGDYFWEGKMEDRVFMVHRGSVIIEIKGKEPLALVTGEIGVVPKSTKHRISSQNPSFVLTVEAAR